MKKSQLRNIIRESINQLMTEQSSANPPPNLGAMLNSYVSFAAGGLQSINNLNSYMPYIRSYIIETIFLHQGPQGNYPFNSSNTNQPCSYINLKIDNLQNWLAQNPNGNAAQIANKQFRLNLYTELLAWAQSHPTDFSGSVNYPWTC